jgi:Alternative complex III, ActD subunit
MTPRLYGVVAEFDNPTALVAAAHRTREAGYSRFEAYAPFPIEDLVEAVGHPNTRLPIAVFLGGLIGGLSGYLLQYYTAVVTYPLNIGGRPLHSWPAFIPVTFECTILGAALTAVFGMLARNGLPMPYHPLFHIPRFARASRDLFFLCIQARDPRFDVTDVTQFLQSLDPADVQEVPR